MAILEAHDLCKTFRSRTRTVEAVRHVSLIIEAGEVLGFLGPNGAGKTTTIKMIAGIIRPDCGTVRVVGRDPHRDPGTLHDVGAVLEGNRNVYWRLTPLENLIYFGVLRGLAFHEARQRGLESLEQFDLLEKRHDTVLQLSRGMQQKLAIAVAFLHRPKLLLLDEPTLGLDVEAAQAVKQMIRRIAAEGHAILLTTHQLNVAQELADRVAIIRQGDIIAESTTQELIERYSGKAFNIEFTGEPTSAQIRQLEGMGAKVHPGYVSYLNAAEGLYEVIRVLEPLPISRIDRDQADLTEVFLKLVRGESDA